MARAGFWAVSSGAISFRHDGRWYSDGEPINNARIASLFSRCLRQTEDGRWNVLYTRVKGGYRARFLRPAYYRLAPAIEERDGRFVLVAGGARTAIGREA